MKDMSDKLRILHLEDNPEDVELVRETIAAQGIDAGITDVETRADFINALEKEEYDLILADYTLPSFDGLSALAIARAKFPLPAFHFRHRYHGRRESGRNPQARGYGLCAEEPSYTSCDINNEGIA